ncbi:V(D)J recombination-activating protein 1-like [Diadema setosum]|uniref:V(D)J recombination-activating protein 1-like n=1 Tax=Diadema setosum TaxID=31175 RepID=UPI003B3ACB5C
MTSAIADYIRVNPDKLSKAELDGLSLGVKQRPLLKSDAEAKLLDATHADINLGIFFKKIIVREIAAVQKWELTEDIKGLVEHAEHKFDAHIRKHVGSAPQLMMPGNYSRQLFAEKNANIILALIPSEERREHLAIIMEKFRLLRSVYRAHSPRVTHAQELRQYKVVAVQMGRELISHFDYVPWPNYLHKVIEHPQEIIENEDGPGSVGTISGEGNEASNKLFRHMRKNLSRKDKDKTSYGILTYLPLIN